MRLQKQFGHIVDRVVRGGGRAETSRLLPAGCRVETRRVALLLEVDHCWRIDIRYRRTKIDTKSANLKFLALELHRCWGR